MGDVNIRTRKEEDLGLLADALVAVHELDGYPVEGVAEPRGWLRLPAMVAAWTAEVDGRVAGQAMLVAATPEEVEIAQSAGSRGPVRTLCRLFVHPEARGRGAARLLLQAVHQFAEAEGSDLLLDVMAKDAAAIRLYESLGWVRIHESVHHFGEGQQTPCYWYWRPADEGERTSGAVSPSSATT